MKKNEVNSSRMPVYRDAGFELFDAATTEAAFRNETEHERDPEYFIYSRYRNPTIVSAEEEIMKLEQCKWALLTQSGMSAIDTATALFHTGKETRPWIFFSEIYGGTISFIESVLKARRGIDIQYFTAEDGSYNLREFEKNMSKVQPSVVFVETISNPMLIVTDVPEIIRIAGKYGSKVIVDNTFATPYLSKPLDDGADIVIHSATKYFSGHGNLSAGVICGNDKDIMKSAIEYRKFVGHMLSPDDAYRLQTQIQSFRLRFVRQCSNASKLAAFLNERSIIGKVWYPGLKSHKTHHIAAKLFNAKGFGGMVTFDFEGSNPEEKRIRRDKFISHVSEKIKLIPTLGDPHTILMPVEAVWGKKYPEPGMLRLSLGFEEYDELEDTVAAALDSIQSL
ncbi:MAG: PLP-dependent transferase [Bacteroidales bacterium]|nr:PLP-dependent transferase [Bacteroidales bacterium]